MAASQTNIGVNAGGDINAGQISVVQNIITPTDPPPKNVRFKVEKPIQTFTGRETFLEKLHKVVKEGQVTVLTQEPLPVVAATGGIGKTETVRRYIQLHGHEYDHIIWIDAEEKSFAQRQFRQLATELNISSDFEGKQKEFESILKEIFGKLLLHAHVVLLVLDNAEAMEDDEELSLSGIRSLRPTSLSEFCVEPTIIVTSRNQNWSHQKVIQLDLWTEAEVVTFVTVQLKLEENSENKTVAIQLGNLFGRLPIALQAAVAVILQQIKRGKKYGIQNLLDEYECGGSRKVLTQKPSDANKPKNTGDTMLVLWNISLEKIVRYEDGELAIKILCFMAYMSQTRIPKNFLFALCKNSCTEDSFENALEILEDYSLIATVSSDDDSDSRSFSIHRMIQDSTIENLRTRSNERRTPNTIFKQTTFSNETEVLLKLSAESLNYLKTFTELTFPRSGELVETLVQITNHVSEKLDDGKFRDLTQQTAWVLGITNNFTKSIELFEKVYIATPEPQSGDELVKFLELLQALADACHEGGHSPKSIYWNLTTLEIATLVLGPDHEYTLDIKCKVASALSSAGRDDEATEMFQEILQGYENNGYTQNTSYLQTKAIRAGRLIDEEERRVAMELLTEKLKKQEKDLEPNSISIKVTKLSIAVMLQHEGHFEEVTKLILQKVEDATKRFGPFSMTTLQGRQAYALKLHEQGKHDLAAPLLLELLKPGETQLDPIHPFTLKTKVLLARVYLATKELDKAEALLDVHVWEKVFSPEHPETVQATSLLANVKEEQEKFRDALALQKQVLEVRKNFFARYHEKTLRTMKSIITLYGKMEEHEKAAPLLRDLLETMKTQFGSDHSSTLETKVLLARVYMETQELDKAEVLLDVDVMEKVLGPEHSTTLNAATMLSHVKKNQGKFREALLLLTTVLEVRKHVLAPNHEANLSSIHTIGNLYFEMKEYKKGVSFLLEQLETYETQLRLDHPFILTTKLRLGSFYFITKELDKAEALLDIDLMERVFGPEHPMTLEAITLLSDVKEGQGKFKEALVLQKKVFKINKKDLGSNHKDTLRTMYEVFFLYTKMEKYKKAAEVLQELLERQEGAFRKDHPDAIKTLESLTSCREIIDQQNYLILALMTLTSVDAQTGKSFLNASEWNLEAALKAYRNSNPNAPIANQDHESTLSGTLTAAENQNDLIIKFMAVTVYAETGKSLLQASDWNLEVALVSFFDSSYDEDDSDNELQDDDLIPSASPTDAEKQKELILNYMAVTKVDIEIGKICLQASDWNLEVALEAFFKSSSDQNTADIDLQDDAFIRSAAATDAEKHNVANAFCNVTEANQIQNLGVQPLGVQESNQPTTSNVLRLAGEKQRQGVFRVSSTAQEFSRFVDKKKQKRDQDSNCCRIFATKLYMASELGHDGHLEEASKMQLQNIKDATKLFGLFHLVTLHCRHLYAMGLGAQKKYDLAAPLLLKLLETEVTQLGSDHCYTLDTKISLAKVYLVTKEHDKAEAILDINKMEKVYGPEHPETLKAAIILSDVKEQQGKLREALALNKKILKVRKNVLGPNHEDTLSTMHTICTLLVRIEEYENAAPLLRELIETQETQLGSDHHFILRTKIFLSRVYFQTEEFDKSEALLDVGVMEKVFGLEDPETLNAATFLSSVKEKQGKLREALALSKKVLEVRKNVLVANHEDTLYTMYNICMLHYKMEEYEKAVEVAQELFERQEKAIGEDHPDAIETLELLTLCRELIIYHNYFTKAFMALTSVDAETGKSFSEASNWKMEAALEAYRNSNPNALIGDQNITKTLSETKTDAEIKNNLIIEFIAVTGISAETGRFLLQASDWNMEVALVSFFDSIYDEDNSDSELQEDALIPSTAETDAENQNVANAFCKKTEVNLVNQIQDLEVQVDSVAEPNPPTTSILFRLAGGKRLQGEFRVSSTVKDLYTFLNETRPDLAKSNFVLTMHPNTKLTKMEETLEEANLLNNVAVTQKILKNKPHILH